MQIANHNKQAVFFPSCSAMQAGPVITDVALKVLISSFFSGDLTTTADLLKLAAKISCEVKNVAR